MDGQLIGGISSPNGPNTQIRELFEEIVELNGFQGFQMWTAANVPKQISYGRRGN